MDKKLERAHAAKALRRFANLVKPFGFVRTKPSLFVREAGWVLEFLHIHKYSCAPSFRIHLCFRVLNEPTEYLALSGVTEDDLCGWLRFDFRASPESVDFCATRMADFVSEHAQPWFSRWSDRRALLSDASPLYPDQKIALMAAMNGEHDKAREARSRMLLKVACQAPLSGA